MTDLAGVIISERAGLTAMLIETAAAREAAPEAADDTRFGVAADCLRQIAKTLDQVPDETLLRLANVNTVSDGLLSRVIAARLCAIGFELPPVDNAREFFMCLERAVAAMLAKGQRLH